MMWAVGKLGWGAKRGRPVNNNENDCMNDRSNGGIWWWSESERMDSVIKESVAMWVKNIKTRGLD